MAFLEVATFKKPLFKVAIGLCAFPLAFASGCAMTSAIKESDLVEAYASNLNLTQKPVSYTHLTLPTICSV